MTARHSVGQLRQCVRQADTLPGAFQKCLCKTFHEGRVNNPKKIINNSSKVPSNANQKAQGFDCRFYRGGRSATFYCGCSC
ncbi:hypothetical protein EMIT0P258_180058 [Pseudomonas sp. IT-P258]